MKAFACVWAGHKYPIEYVQRLKRNLETKTQVDKFYCLTNNPVSPVEGINWVVIPRAHDGWWNKIELFNQALDLPQELFYLDLDVVIVRDLEPMWNIPLDRMLSIQDFHPVTEYRTQWMNSSAMRFDRSKLAFVYDQFVKQEQHWMERFPGDQNYLTHILDDQYQRWPQYWCQSYKWQVQKTGLHADCKIAVFHGRPKPHEVDDPLVRDNWFL
jgi:hypothetical protein